jgi:predicted ABC-type ATPase
VTPVTSAEWGSRILTLLGNTTPVLVMLAGSNGAGKTTFFRRHLAPTGIVFVNADDIARTLFPGAPEDKAYEAMQIAERLRADLLARRESFCMETVLSDTQGAKLAFLKAARDAGYRVIVIFIRLRSPDLSAARVHQRVRRGGHAVPAGKLRERFPRTLANAPKALALADFGPLLDNSSARSPYRWIQTWEGGRCITRSEEP